MNKSTHLDLPLRVNPVKGVEKQREELRNVQETEKRRIGRKRCYLDCEETATATPKISQWMFQPAVMDNNCISLL